MVYVCRYGNFGELCIVINVSINRMHVQTVLSTLHIWRLIWSVIIQVIYFMFENLVIVLIKLSVPV